MIAAGGSGRRAGLAGAVTRLRATFGAALLLAVALLGAARAAPPPALFDVAWADRGDILATVREEARPAAAALVAAPIYHLDLELAGPRRLEGRMELRVVNREDTAWDELVLWLHAVRLGATMTVTDVLVDGVPAATTPLQGGAALSVGLASLDGGGLAPGAAAVVRASYTLEIARDPAGNYGLLALEGGVLSLPHAYPTLAARDRGAWDLAPPAPYGDLGTADAGFYRLRLTMPASLTLAAAGLERAEVGDTHTTWEVRAGPVRDVFLSISDFAPQRARAGDVTVRAFGRPGREAAAARAAGIAASAIDIFGRLYGAYPYPEFDLVPMATDALGVEFPTIVALTLDLFEAPSSPVFEAVIVHEVAHQWFYGLVGVDQISDPWLDESVAQYLTLRYYEERYGRPAAQGFRASLVERDARTPDAAARFLGGAVTDYSAPDYSSLIYGTGALLLDGLRGDLPDGALDRALAELVQRNLWQRPSPGAFFEALADVCGCEPDPAVVERFVRTKD